jgi:serine protease Do
MTSTSDGGPSRRARSYAVTLTVVAALILVLGLLLRPTPRDTSPPPPSELDLARLARLAQRRQVESSTEFFAALANDQVRWLTSVQPLGTSGVIWRPDLVVVPGTRGPMPPEITLRWADRSSRAWLVVSGPDLPIAAYRTGEPLAEGSTLPARQVPESGDWLLAVNRDGDRPVFATGTFVAATQQSCEFLTLEVVTSTLAIAPATRGSAVFDLDGGLVGIVAACGGQPAILSHRGVDRLLEHGQSLEGRVVARFGFRAVQPSLDEAAHLKITEGALVREVWNGYPADLSGLWPGDVIREVGGRAIAVPADLAPVLDGAPDATTVKVRRGSRELVLELAADRPPAAGQAAVVLESDRKGHRIEAVSPGTAAFTAGLRAGDVLLRINHAEPKNVSQLRRLLAESGSAAAFVEVERDGRRFGVLVS